mgnify:CR=1 FL=1
MAEGRQPAEDLVVVAGSLNDQRPATLPRFSPVTRIAHWTLALPFLFLLATGLLLYVPRLKAIHVGGYRLLPLLHVIAGLALIVALVVVYLLQPGRRALYRDLRRLVQLGPGDLAWLRYAGYALLGARVRQPPTGKFNAGQKANGLASAVFTSGLIATGSVLAVNFFTKAVFSTRFVEQVYPLHDLFTIVAIPVVAVHIFFATLNPSTRPSLRGMLDGRVDRAWARKHHDRWAAEVEAVETPSVDVAVKDSGRR